MNITYSFRKINSNVFENVIKPVFSLNACPLIAKESRWLHSPLQSPHTNKYNTYNFPRVCLASLTYIHRETHIPIVKLHVHPEHIGADNHIHKRDIQNLCTLHWGQTWRQKFTKLYGGNLPNWTAALFQSIRRSHWVRSVSSGAGVAMGGLIQNITAPMYQIVQRQYTKLYSGNVPNCTAGICVGAWWHPDKIPWINSKAQISPPVVLYYLTWPKLKKVLRDAVCPCFWGFRNL